MATWYRSIKRASTPYGCWVGPQGQVNYCDTQEHGFTAADILGSLGKPFRMNVQDPNALDATEQLLGMGWARLILPWPNLQLKTTPSRQQGDAIVAAFRKHGAKSVQVEMPNAKGKYTLPQLQEIFNGRDPKTLQTVESNPWANPEMYTQASRILRKQAATVETLPYFQELDETGEYTPDVDHVAQVIKQKFNATITGEIGRGDSGIAYRLSNGKVLKVSTNDQEGKMAQWLVRNPHPNIVRYYDAWKDGNLWYEVMDYLNVSLSDPASVDQFAEIAEKARCFDPSCAVRELMKPQYRNLPHIGEVISVLKHLSRFPGRQPFDFLNSSNIGEQNGKLIFFDIT